ncbi:MAG: alkyl hydroperoxide reductase, partial [Candidatus Hydrogenedentota bacterium]
LLETPNYDFNWQIYYYFQEPKFIPKGTRIEVELVYDNSPENGERAGFNSNRAVRFGGPTTDEMDLGWYTYSAAKPDLSD